MQCICPVALVTLGIRLIEAIAHAYAYKNRSSVSTRALE